MKDKKEKKIEFEVPGGKATIDTGSKWLDVTVMLFIVIAAVGIAYFNLK